MTAKRKRDNILRRTDPPSLGRGSSSHFDQVINDKLRKVNVGVIGVGCIGQEHLRNLLLLSDCARIYAISDNDPPSIKMAIEIIKKSGQPIPKVFAECKDLLRDKEIDAVIVATPNHTHRDILEDCFKLSDAALLVEKPLCINADECSFVEDLAKRQPGRLVWVGMEYRFIPSVAKLLSCVDSGEIGEVKMVSIREHRFPFLTKVGRWNRFNNMTGGTLVEKCCHFFDLMRRIVQSDPVKVIASGAQDVNYQNELIDGQKPDILDNAYVIVEFANSSRSILDLCMFAEASYYQEEISVVGTKGKVEAFVGAHGQESEDENKVNFRIGFRPNVTVDNSLSVSAPKPVDVQSMHISVGDQRLIDAGRHEGSTYYELVEFLKAVKCDPLVSIEDGKIAVATGLAAQDSIHRGGTPVFVSDYLD